MQPEEHAPIRKTLALLAAGFMIASFAAPAAYAQTVDAKKLSEACKGKKAGDMVKVDGKDAKCPTKQQ